MPLAKVVSCYSVHNHYSVLLCVADRIESTWRWGDERKLWHKDNKVDQSKKWEGAREEEQQCQPSWLCTSKKVNGLWMALSLLQKNNKGTLFCFKKRKNNGSNMWLFFYTFDFVLWNTGVNSKLNWMAPITEWHNSLVQSGIFLCDFMSVWVWKYRYIWYTRVLCTVLSFNKCFVFLQQWLLFYCY